MHPVAGTLVDRVAGVRIFEVRIDLRDVGDAVERTGAGAHEVGVERQVAVEPVDLRRERRPVAGHRKQPLRRPLEHGDMRGLQARSRGSSGSRCSRCRSPRPVCPSGRSPAATAPYATRHRRTFRRRRSGDVRPAEKTDRRDHRARADRRAPSGPSMAICHSPAASSQVSDLTSVSNWMCRRRSKLSATQSKYFTFSRHSQNGLG